MRLVRRLLACVLLLLVVGETSGVARAFGPGSTVRCCCGPHASARPCPCPDCPVMRLRAHRHEASAAALGRNCSGPRDDDPGILSIVALAVTPPALAVDRIGVAFALASAPAPRVRWLDAARPPP
jgi:hypothetical protein